MNVNSFKEEGYFYNRRGLKIHYSIWKPATGKIKNIAMVVHGLGEHIGRYEEFANFVRKYNFITFGIDFYGFGKSEGKRGHVFSIEDYVYDLKTMYNLIAKDYNNTEHKLILGHSMGGLLAIAYIEKYQKDFNLSIISAPALNPLHRVSKPLYLLSKIIKPIFPSLTISHGLKSSEITSDSKEQENLKKDELVHDRISLNLFFEMVELAGIVTKNVNKINTESMLFLHGDKDTIALKEDTERFFNRLDIKNKSLVILPDMKHEVLTDINKSKTYNVIEDWLVSVI